MPAFSRAPEANPKPPAHKHPSFEAEWHAVHNESNPKQGFSAHHYREFGAE
jgi:hypothetical protein